MGWRGKLKGRVERMGGAERRYGWIWKAGWVGEGVEKGRNLK